MKKLFTLLFAIFIGTTTFAQSWKEGEEITDKIEWGNLSFENETIAPWVLVRTGGNTTETGGAFELYDGSDCELYQIVKLPAGMYEVTCQGYYRWGTSWDEDPNQYGKDAWENNAFLRVANGKYDIGSNEFTEDREFKSPLMPRLFEEVYEMLFEDTDYTLNDAGEKVFAAGWDMSDGRYDQVDGKYGPCSVPGSLVWFQAGKYQPYNDGAGTKYNTVKFFLLEDGYVKLGVKKTKAKSADSFMVTNFRMYYQGEAGEAAQLILALDELEEEMGKALLLSDEIRNAEYGSLAAFLFDETFDLEYDEDNLESVLGAIESMKKINANYQDYYLKAQQFTSLIKAVENMLASTDYTGKDECQAALDEAKRIIDDGNGDSDVTLESAEDYITAMNNLSKARSNYLMGQEPENGARNFTAFINYPWFCLPQYEPTWDAENNTWVPNQAALNTDSGDGTPWSEKDDVNGTINNIAAGVNVYGTPNDVGVWYQHGGGGTLEVYWNDKLTCIKKWSLVAEDFHDVSQRITNLPNGYYKLKALAQTWTNDWNNNCMNHIYIKSNAGESHSPYLTPGGWWGNDINQWLELETGMVLVDDSEVIISSRDNGFAAFTGFRLYYYGETPGFDEMIRPKKEAVYANFAEQYLWNGDNTAVYAMLAELPETISTYEEYTKVDAELDKINAYINNAANIIANCNVLENYITLQSNYAEGTDEYDILTPAIEFAFTLGEGENDSYVDANKAAETYNAYNEYMSIRDQASKYDSAELNDLLNSEAETLKNKYSSIEELTEFMNALKAPINKSIFASLGADKATEYTPVDVTVLLVNPTFQYGPNYGWTGVLTDDNSTLYANCNEFGREQAEIWNVGPFDFYQKVRALPAGAYELRCRGLYRDAGDPGSVTGGPYYNWWYAAGCEMELWENKNTVLYMNNGTEERSDYLKSICDGQFTEPSFEGFFKITDGDYSVGNNGSFIWYEELTDEDKEAFTDPETGEYYYDDRINMDSPGYPYDAKVVDGDDTFWYPTSMAGVYRRMQMNPEAWCNSVQIMVEEGSTLKLGLKKTAAIGGDWAIFDDFQLFYLGTKTPDAIEGIASETPATTSIYNLAGQKLNAIQKGINIVNGKKILVK